MIAEKITFSEQHRVLDIFINNNSTIEALKLNFKRPVIVVIGGADNIDDYHQKIIEQSARTIAKAAAKSQAIVLSGGTNSGVMAAMGQARAEGNYNFPLIGVAVKKMVSQADAQEEAVPLEPNHTHFLLVPGNKWGDESLWIAKLATVLAGKHSSVTVLSNGGEISLRDVMLSMKAKRPVVVLEGTGRLADELARILASSELIKIIPAKKDRAVFEAIYGSLVTSPDLIKTLDLVRTAIYKEEISLEKSAEKLL